MRKLFLFILVASLAGCGPGNYNGNYQQQGYQQQPQTQVTVNGNNTPGLDLQALGELVKSCSNAQDIEKKLNDPSTGVNNIDLNGTGQVDYVNVTEYNNNGARGFDFYVTMKDGSKQDVATVEMSQSQGSQQATMNIVGNQNVYGPNASYTSNYALTDLLIWSYFMTPHSYWASPYSYGYYPSYYHRWGCVPYNTYYSGVRTRYVTRTRITRSTSTITTRSPNASKYSSSSYSNSNNSYSRRSSLSNSTGTQRQFTQRNSSQSKPSGNAFRNSSSSSSNTHSSSGTRSSFGGSKSSSFGGSRSSGGRRR